MITSEEKKHILAKVLELAQLLPPIEPGEFTINESAEAAGICYATASRRLSEMAGEGKLLRRRMWNEAGRGGVGV